jgi:hypothetical protein
MPDRLRGEGVGELSGGHSALKRVEVAAQKFPLPLFESPLPPFEIPLPPFTKGGWVRARKGG